jgi:hypothetical protein
MTLSPSNVHFGDFSAIDDTVSTSDKELWEKSQHQA